ncbi:MAG: hypothetical protein JW869_04895 [Candidatus Omnitrophica bacterium]|nr:hypothetical protein [Candidatus Omnitrophota bacterium]
MQEEIKCIRCGRQPSQQLENGEYWCSWCGQAFKPGEKDTVKDEEMLRKPQSPGNQIPTVPSIILAVITFFLFQAGLGPLAIVLIIVAAIFLAFRKKGNKNTPKKV